MQIGKLCKSLMLKYVKHTVRWTYENLSIKTIKFFRNNCNYWYGFYIIASSFKLKISDKMFSDLFEFERDCNTYVRSIIYTCSDL